MGFQFLCERLVPGCSEKIEKDDKDELVHEANRHMKDHHDRELDAALRAEIDTAVLFLPH